MMLHYLQQYIQANVDPHLKMLQVLICLPPLGDGDCFEKKIQIFINIVYDPCQWRSDPCFTINQQRGNVSSIFCNSETFGLEN